MKRWRALGVVVLGTIAWLACADDPHKRTTAAQAQNSGGACEAKPGSLPAPNCDDSTHDCPNQPGCTIDEAKCGSAATCLPLSDNKGKDVQDFRIRRLNITTPPALAGKFIQSTIVTLGNCEGKPTSCEVEINSTPTFATST